MTSDVRVERLEPHRDPRGLLIEPLLESALSAQRNVHVVWTAPGAIRGNHYHARGTEVTMVRGPALVRYRNAAGTHDVRVPGDGLYRFTFPPQVPHAFAAPGPTEMFLIGFNTEPHISSAPDAVPEVLLERSDLR